MISGVSSLFLVLCGTVYPALEMASLKQKQTNNPFPNFLEWDLLSKTFTSYEQLSQLLCPIGWGQRVHVPYPVLKAAVCVCVPRVACSNWLSQAATTLERTSLWYCSPFSSTPSSLS